MNINKVEVVTCPKCGWKHSIGTVFCRFCGSTFGEIKEVPLKVIKPKPIKKASGKK